MVCVGYSCEEATCEDRFGATSFHHRLDVKTPWARLIDHSSGLALQPAQERLVRNHLPLLTVRPGSAVIAG